MHLIQQGYNRIMDWFQGKGSDEDVQIKELLPREQVSNFLQAYNKVSQELERIIHQIESDNSVASNMLGWLKEYIVEHRAQGQQLVNQQMVAQENIKAYFENLQAVAKDLTELVEDLAEGSNSIAVAYAQTRLVGINQKLAKLLENPAIISKDQETLRANVRAQMAANTLHQQQAMNVVPQATINSNMQVAANITDLLV
jgi:prophage DNA circulation protein